MRVLFDHQTFVYQKFGGISRYFTELAKSLRSFGADARISALLSDNIHLAEVHKALSVLDGRFPGSMTFYTLVNQLRSRSAIAGGRFDVFHPTYYDTYFLDVIGDKPFVLTVHDLIHELYPGRWPNQEKILRNKAALIRKARHIIAISDYTKNDLLRIYPEIPASSVSVVWHGISGSVFSQAEAAGQIDFPYLLFVGKRDEYKNFSFLVSTIRPFFESNPSVKLIAAGGEGITHEEKAFLGDLNISGSVVFLPGIDDRRLQQLYRHAIAFIFPSAYEGFGMPVLEAFACGCPVILNNASCFPEIAGSAAMYFEEDKPGTLLAAVEKVMHDPALREDLVRSGRTRLQDFTWEKTASQTLEVYRKVV